MRDIEGVAAGTTKARVGREYISVADFHWLVQLLEVVARRLDDASVVGGHRALMETLWARHGAIVAPKTGAA
jgi:hypothetical protein